MPSGFFAKITGIAYGQGNPVGYVLNGISMGSGVGEFQFTLSSGSSIGFEESAGNAFVSYYIGIELYKNP